MTRIGLIGCGNISATHARAIAGIPDAAVVAVYGPRLERARQLAAGYDAIAADSLDEFFDRAPMDVVAIGTPSGLHGEHGTAAARRGIHVLVEKPIEVSAERADRLIAEAAGARVTLGVIFQDRLKPAVQEMKSLVDAGALGTPILASARVPWHRPPEYYRDSAWRGTKALDGGGALINQAAHTVDLLLWFCGPAARVSGCVATRLHDIEVEDTAVASLTFASGAIGTIEAATSAWPGRPRRIELTGSEGTLVLEGDRLAVVELRRGGRQPGAAETQPENSISAAVSDPGSHRAVFVDFLRAVARAEKPCCDGLEGRRSLELTQAIYRSAADGIPVNLE